MPQITPIKGFVNTPVTKKVVIFSTIAAILVSVFQIKYLFTLSIDPLILEYNQFWRIVTFQLSVINESDYLLTMLLWFQFKNLERFYGSQKYLSLILILSIYNAVVTFLVMSLGQLLINFIDYFILTIFKLNGYAYFTTILNSVIPGPIGLLSSLYICFGTYIPISYQFKILLSNPIKNNQEDHSKSKELLLTDHFHIHIVYTLLLFNNGFKSFVPSIIGLFIGKLYTSELLPGSKSWLLPTTLFKIFINPFKILNNIINLIRRRFSGYQSINQIIEDDDQNEETNEREEIVDDMRNNESEIRAETPVRPLASQFLDTFRTRGD